MSTNLSFKSLAVEGLWKNNAALVQILGMCPLLAVSTSVTNGIGLGLATTVALTASNAAVASIRRFVRPEIRIPVFVVIIAAVVTVIELAMNAYFHELYLILGIFIPLIVTNCIVIARAEAFAARNPVLASAFDGFVMGLGGALVLIILGGLRELIGHGTLFAGVHLMFGDSARWLTVNFSEHYHGFLLALLPPGAFIGLACLIALKNVIDARLAKRQAQLSDTVLVDATNIAVAAAPSRSS